MLDNFPNNFRRDDEEVFNEFRQKQVNFDLEERRNATDSSQSWFIGALAGLIMAGIVGWFVLAPKYSSDGSEEVPVITKPQMPVKVQPSEPGNIEFAAQERTVYDIIEKKQTSEENDNLVTSEEEPNTEEIEKLAEKNVVIEDRVRGGESFAFRGRDNSVRSVLMAPNPRQPLIELNSEEKAAPEPQAEAGEEVTEVVVEEVDAVEETKPVEEVKVMAKEVVEEPEKDTIITLETVKAAENKTVVESKPVAEVANGKWQVQLMSSPNKAAVEKSWVEMSNKYSLLSNVSHNIESADLGAKGIFYRLKAGNFATKDEATAFCNKLKAVGGNCFVAQK